METEKKILYIPSQRKRFEVSPDPYSRKRITHIKNTYKELTESIPGISVGFSLFGSLSKGKHLEKETAVSADIDLAVYIDREDTVEQYKNLLDQSEVYKEMFEFMQDVAPLREDKVDEQVLARDAMYHYVRRFLLARSQSHVPLHLFIADIALQGEGSIINTLHNILIEPQNVISGSRRHFANFFNLDVGGGLKKYRQEFVRSLGQLETDEAEAKWHVVRDIVEKFERKEAIPQDMKHRFPQTYIDAVKYYCVK